MSLTQTHHLLLIHQLETEKDPFHVLVQECETRTSLAAHLAYF